MAASAVCALASDLHAQSAGVDGDRQALIALYEATDGPNWTFNTNWASDAPLSDWYGVSTDAAGRVVSVYLKGRLGSFLHTWTTNGLSGRLPRELGDLEYLTVLNLGINNIRGPIPKELGNLTRLTQLNLEVNELTGDIPGELGNLIGLTSLRLANNRLTGPIPAEIGNLTALKFFDISGNTLSGLIPVELFELTRLTTLNLGGNDLYGELPDEIGHLTNLRRLVLDFNSLSGPIPATIGNLAALTYLSAFDNNLNGAIPSTIGKLTNLTDLDLGWNFLSGSLPNEIGNLSALESLDVGRNEISGRINPHLTKLTNLAILNLSNNKLDGPVISGLRHMPSLEYLFLGNNNLSGPLPTRFVDARNLDVFSISGNQVCVPGTHSFIFWLDRVLIHDILALDFCNATDRTILERLHSTTNGESWINSRGWGDDVALERWHGVETDALGQVVSLNLASNSLVGSVPLDLGFLSELRHLNIKDNQLEGRLPLSLRRLDLHSFQFTDTELCVPREMDFQSWLDESVAHAGPGLLCEPLTEREIMTMFFTETNGESWSDTTNWDSTAPLQDWYGINVDENGEVTSLEIVANNLSGRLPVELTRLSKVQVLNLRGNAITGSIPPEIRELVNLTSLDLSINGFIGDLPIELGELEQLTSLDLSFNRLNGNIPSELANLAELKTLRLLGNDLSGDIPAQLGDLSNLEVLGLSYNRFSGSIPSEIGNLQNLVSLQLQGNDLVGAIPPEVGRLTNLEGLLLGYNDLSGTIPTHLSNLTNLQILGMSFNRLNGEIPIELGGLNALQYFNLRDNRLVGQIPREFGNLSELETLILESNRLAGLIPAELGDLGELQELHLQDNELSGALPKELGALSKLDALYLDGNNLTGEIPPEFGQLTNLTYLTLSENLGLSGPIPIELTALTDIEVFLTVGTRLCIPLDLAFSEWLVRVYKRRIRSCQANGPLVTLVMQPVQSHEYPVPLVAGEKALLRVFPMTADLSDASIPETRVRFYRGDQEIYAVNVPSRDITAPALPDPGNLASSSNFEIPGTVIQAGLEISVETNSTDTDVERLPVEVHELADFELTLIPFIWQGDSDRSIVELVDAMAADSQTHELLEDTRTLLPIAGLNVYAHEPVTSSSNNPFDLLMETSAIRAVEGGSGYYMGMMSSVRGAAAGVAYLSGRDSFSIPISHIIAHELGHNLSLLHAPCGGPAGIDSSFPHANGTLGSWGYDFRDGGSLVRPTTADLMSYCQPVWISDYHFTNALRYRLLVERETTSTVSAARPSLLVWGGQRSNNELVLNPSFLVNAPPILPSASGDFELRGRRVSGDEMFSLNFDMQEIGDLEGSRGFVFAIPVESEWAYKLDAVTLTGPAGSEAVDIGNAATMSMLRNPVTRQIRGVFRTQNDDSAKRTKAILDEASQRGFEVLHSRNSPEAVLLDP